MLHLFCLILIFSDWCVIVGVNTSSITMYGCLYWIFDFDITLICGATIVEDFWCLSSSLDFSLI